MMSGKAPSELAMTQLPMVSVVTVNFNMASEIAGTLDSILAQDYPRLETIVIDGASTDGSGEIIAGYASRLSYWVSEPDRNLYDGVNKGVRAATGDWILFMNSGDRFADPGVLRSIFSEDSSEADVIYGHHVRHYLEYGIERLVLAETPSVLPFRMHCSHQSLFMRREILQQHPFALDLLAADYEALLAAYLGGRRFKAVDRVVSIVSAGGRSDNNRIAGLFQRMAVLRRHGQMNMALALHYSAQFVRVVLVVAIMKIMPKPFVAFVRRHRRITGLG